MFLKVSVVNEGFKCFINTSPYLLYTTATTLIITYTTSKLGACMWLSRSGKGGLVALSGNGLMYPGSRAMYLGGHPGSLKW